MEPLNKGRNPMAGSASTPADTGVNAADVQVKDPSSEYSAEYLVYLRLIQDLPAAAPFNLGDDKLRHMPPGNQESGWQNCLNSVEKYDRELCQAYREQIDTLLVFAGLFSAVVTAFAVESYQWLQDDPIDTSVQLLRDVVFLLSQTTNSTPPSVPNSAHQLSGAAIVRINSFWFLSLTLSLSAALVGILCKQWLREFERNVGQSPETALAVRHIRFQGFEFWKVGSIVTSVPIIMQIALAFFVIGIIELLWHLHVIVACCVTVTAGFTLAFYLATTLIPIMQYVYICIQRYTDSPPTRDYHFLHRFMEPQCAYKSAQAWLAFRVCRPLINHLLRIYGYEFSSYYPPVFVRRVLRPIDSWVDFDLNWVKCRENLQLGSGCAFESLTWIAANLGEMHMNSWIWHCVWARWLKNRDSHDNLRIATTEIESVARSYPRIIALGDNHTPLTRSQALIFQCSLRTDLPVDTAIELLLRVTAESGPGSQWTREAAHLVRIVYSDQYIRLSDDTAIGLFRLAKHQVYTIVRGEDEPNSITRYNAAVAFRHIVVILHRGTPLRDILVPAMAGLALQWLRSNLPRPIALVARAVLKDILQGLIYQGYRGPGIQDLRQHRGIILVANLAGAVAELWPEDRHVYPLGSDKHAVLSELLAIYADGLREVSQDHADARTSPAREPVFSADGERSSAPEAGAHADSHACEETHDEPPNQAVRIGETPESPHQAHLCIDVQMEAEMGAETTEVGMNSPASPAANPVAPASPPRSPVSSDVAYPPSG